MQPDYIHDTGIPVARQRHAYEYRFPLRGIPVEADPEWRSWLTSYTSLSPNDVHEIIRKRLEFATSQVIDLAAEVQQFRPFAMLVFAGTPFIWLERSAGEYQEIIYLSPDVTDDVVRSALSVFHLESNTLLVEFVRLFGGMGDRRPWESVEFSGRRERGRIIIDSASDFFSERLRHRSAEQGETIRRAIAPWLSGAELLCGEGGLTWFINSSGAVCEYSRDDCEVLGASKSLPTAIEAFLDASTPSCLFKAAYDGML